MSRGAGTHVVSDAMCVFSFNFSIFSALDRTDAAALGKKSALMSSSHTLKQLHSTAVVPDCQRI